MTSFRQAKNGWQRKAFAVPDLSKRLWAGSGPFRLPGGYQADLQPPLPLQSFLPLQPCSLALQPPWPLQLLRPLQSCLAVEVSGDAAALPELSADLLQPVTPMVPATNPAIAAEMINVLAVLVIIFPELFVSIDFSIPPARPQTVMNNLRVRRSMLIRRDSERILTTIRSL